MQNVALTRDRLIDSIVVAVTTSSQFINFVALKYGVEGVLTPLFVVNTALLLLSIIIRKDSRWMVNYPLMFLLLLIISFYVGSFFSYYKPTINTFDFLSFCIIPLLIGAIVRPDYELVLRLLMVVLCIAIPVFSAFFAKNNISINYNAIGLGSSYAVLPVILAGIVHYAFYRKKQGFWVYVLYLISVVFFVYFIPNSYRGPLLSAFITLILVFVATDESRKIYKKLLIVGTLIAGVVFFFTNTISLIDFCQAILSKFDLSVAAIDKTIILSEDISDGRNDIYMITINLIQDSLLFGHGISSFSYFVRGIDYPHNFILQFLFDGGIVLFAGVCILVIPNFKKSFMNKENLPHGKIAILILLAGIEINRALFSGDVWRIIQFWLLIGLLLNNNDNNDCINNNDDDGNMKRVEDPESHELDCIPAVGAPISHKADPL